MVLILGAVLFPIFAQPRHIPEAMATDGDDNPIPEVVVRRDGKEYKIRTLAGKFDFPKGTGEPEVIGLLKGYHTNHSGSRTFQRNYYSPPADHVFRVTDEDGNLLDKVQIKVAPYLETGILEHPVSGGVLKLEDLPAIPRTVEAIPEKAYKVVGWVRKWKPGLVEWTIKLQKRTEPYEGDTANRHVWLGRRHL